MPRTTRYALAALLGASASALTPLAVAHAQEVVQRVPGEADRTLREALQRLERNPRSVAALVAAGRASLELDDLSGAFSFLSRAQAEDPNDGRVLAGLGLLAVRRGEAVTAVQLFDNADAAGEPLRDVAADRGLAYDLVGDNVRAQRYYRQALSREETPETVRRLALSYAIAGDSAASETTLLPLLQRQDRAAFRTRAFALAIMGRHDEAISIAETMLPARLSGRLAPYLRYMPRLTRAQQAAAANLGQFPSVAQIGQDSPQIAALATASGAPPQAARSAVQPRSRRSDRLTPAGTPLGGATAQPAATQPAATRPTTTQPAATQPATSQPVASQPAAVAQPATTGATGELPAVGVAAAEISQPPPRPQQPVVAATLPERTAQPAVGRPPAETARPSFSLSEPAAAEAQPVVQPVANPPVSQIAEVAVPEPAREQSGEQIALAEAFADFTLPASSMPRNADAVDITTIQPARPVVEPKPEPAPEPAAPPPPAHPSRHWVQVATGQDTAAFRFDWRRIARGANGLLDDRKPFTASWGQTNRLVTGPFDSRNAAQDFVTKLGEAGVDAFRFTSENGEEVRPIG